MIEEVEIALISCKYESFRLKDKKREEYLLSSILEYGIREPLQCAGNKNGLFILLDGYKRFRCCQKLKLSMVPVSSLGSDEASSILSLIRLSNEKTLNILEQAQFVTRLYNEFGLSVSEIGRQLERSPAWVSVRLGILGEMSKYVKKEVFNGRFPLRSYMYTLRSFTRVNKISLEETDRFVKAVSGKGLSTRNIERLAYGYFRGGNNLKNQILKGNISWALRQLNYENSHSNNVELTKEESHSIRDLELADKYISRVRYDLRQKNQSGETFIKTIKLLIEGVLQKIPHFVKELKEFYDKR